MTCLNLTKAPCLPILKLCWSVTLCLRVPTNSLRKLIYLEDSNPMSFNHGSLPETAGLAKFFCMCSIFPSENLAHVALYFQSMCYVWFLWFNSSPYWLGINIIHNHVCFAEPGVKVMPGIQMFLKWMQAVWWQWS